jgi:hypothetical protein
MISMVMSFRDPQDAWPAEACGNSTVFLHEPSTLRSPFQPACLGFTICVQKNNARKTCSDMSKVNRSQVTWVRLDVLGLFLASVGSFSGNVGLNGLTFSDNLG